MVKMRYFQSSRATFFYNAGDDSKSVIRDLVYSAKESVSEEHNGETECGSPMLLLIRSVSSANRRLHMGLPPMTMDVWRL